MLQYPVDAGVRDGSVLLKLEDVNCLRPEGFLNDQMIDFYMKYILMEKLNVSARESIHLFSSLFYTSLSSLKLDKQSGWTRRVRNLFDKKFFVIPCVTSGHWLLAIVCNPGKVIEKTKSDEPDAKRLKLSNGDDPAGDGEEDPMILLLDSYVDYEGVQRSRIGTTIRLFLANEWKFRFGTTLKINSKNMPLIIPKVPQQSNLFDCGIYTLHFFEHFFLFPLSWWSNSFKTLSRSWFQNFTEQTETDKREQVFQTIRQLLQQRSELSVYLTVLPAKSHLLPMKKPSDQMNPGWLAIVNEIVKKFFQGHGQRLGGNQPLSSNDATNGGLSAAKSISKDDLDKVQASVDVDDSQPKVKVQIRMWDGSRHVVTLNPSQPVRKLREFICLLHPDLASRPFSLMTTFPSKEFTDESISIEEAKLKDTIVTQKLN